jgi:DNA polymerase-3 subunit epsilon
MSWLSSVRRRTPLIAVRWVVVDCETSGLDPAHDRLLAIGAVSVRAGRIELAESFSTVLQQSRPSDPANILVHGLGADAQRGGRSVSEALEDFRAFLADGVPVAFHAAFDAELLRRALPRRMPRRWLDLAALAPALHPTRAEACSAFDDWLVAFGIEPQARHTALDDAFCAAQLLLVLLAEAERQGATTLESVMAVARNGRWLAPR